MDEYYLLLEQLKSSKAYQIEGRLITLSDYIYVFNHNYKDVVDFVNKVKNPQVIFPLISIENTQALDISINEVVRRLFNFLSSATALVDQTRIAINYWYAGNEFLYEYKSEVKNRFVNNSLTGFIEELRNFSLHYSLPITHAVFSINIENGISKGLPNFQYVIKKRPLLQFSGWTQKKGKPFFSTFDDEIEIQGLLESYYKQASDFHSWLFNRIKEIHSEDLIWLSEIKERINSLLPKE